MGDTTEKTGFLEESPGVKSCMRMMSLLVFFLHAVVDVLLYLFLTIGYYKDHILDVYIVTLILGINFLFLISEFYPKYLQKIIEIGVARFQQIKDGLGGILPAKEITTVAKEMSSVEKTTTETK